MHERILPHLVYAIKTTVENHNLLTGLIFDYLGYAMSPKTSRREGGKTYTYYVSQAAIQRAAPQETVLRPVSAVFIEDLIRCKVDRVIKAAGIRERVLTNGATSDNPSVLIRRYVSRGEVHKMQTYIVFDVLELKKESGVGVETLLGRVTSNTTDNERVETNESNLIVIVSLELQLAKSVS